MNLKKCKLIFSDGTILTPYINGTNFVFAEKQNEDIFGSGNMSILKIQIEDQPEIEYHDILFIQQMLFEGEWYIALRQKTEDEKREERIIQLEKENAELKQRCLDTEAGLIEVAGIMEANTNV